MAEQKHPKRHGKKQNGQHFTTGSVEVESSSDVSSQFISRLNRLPIFNDSVATVTTYVKSAPYGDYVLGKSYDTFSTVHKYAQPYVETVQLRIQPTLGKVDELAVKALDNIEQNFPVVKQPTSEILDTVTKPSLQYYAEVKKTVETKVAEPAAQAATTLAKGVNQRASIIVNGVEAVVDRFLPGESVTRTTSSDENQMVRLYDITTSLPTRVTTLVSIQLDQHNIPHTAEDFKKIRDANALLRETTVRIETLQAQLKHWVAVSKDLATQKIPSTINQKVEEARTKVVAGFDGTINAVTANEKVQFYTQELLTTLDKAAEYAKHHGPTLPEYVQVRLNPLFDFVNEKYQLVAVELNRPNVLPSEKAKNILLLTQQQVLPLMKKSLDDITETVRAYQKHYLSESERVLDGFKTSLKGFVVPVK